jgi:DNA recombination protein RmuC
MRLVGENLSSASKTTSDLVNALRNAPKARGRWGEEALKNVLQLSGLTPGVDFHEQASHQGDDGKVQPDFIIRLPGERCIIVDSKVPLSGYLDAMNATTDEARDACLKKHASELRTHMTQLGSKDYWRHVPSSADYVIMFVPGDNFIAAAFERDQDLYQDGFAKRVIVLGPSNLFALAKTIAFGWRQEEVQKNADDIAKLGRDLYTRLAKLSQLVGGVGSSIERSVKSYNELVSSLDSRVMVTARKFKELGAAEGAEPVEPAQVDTMPRLPAPQLDFELTPPVIEQRRRLGKL